MRHHLREFLSLTSHLIKWTVLGTLIGWTVGSACALFLVSLDGVTAWHAAHPWLLWLLPAAGAFVGWMYQSFGSSVESGNNLIFEEINEPSSGVPLRMAPMVLLGTLVTHLFGGSAGREGTAVQMGGSLAHALAVYVPGIRGGDVQVMLMAGIAAGFGGVFGTPVAGTVFALEVLVIGRLDYRALLPCLIAALVSDRTCWLWGAEHTPYHVASVLPAGANFQLAPLDVRLTSCVALAGILFGLTSFLFAELLHEVHRQFHRGIPSAVWRPFIGGLVVAGLAAVLGSRDYLGLGVSSRDPHSVTIVSSFVDGGAHPWSWWWKIVFTVITLGSGFKGGEVTPLFFIGATLGNIVATATGSPVDLFAALGFLSLFAGATNTPIACTIMGVELFGGEFVHCYAISCVLAYLFSGHSGIYLSQRVGTPKHRAASIPGETSLRDSRASHRRVKKP